MSDKNNSKDFESSLEKLEEIVAELESGDLPLEKSIKAFEEGIKLTRHCQNLLSKAELKIQKLVETNDGSLDLEAFDED
ncbi:MAG: exodeoxyribonuclease VII small subunit [Flavobacteriaceae bacterium]|jgi:exodeoxyribonuclease VII small subunit|nr:exodeoxyribonuclease VII small subunit [Flavobacteriaceae bacterium]|tara:strand:- start:1761 stop:1997 length:237 start_codon:yes stop_codon:yes gene_type:complete